MPKQNLLEMLTRMSGHRHASMGATEILQHLRSMLAGCLLMFVRSQKFLLDPEIASTHACIGAHHPEAMIFRGETSLCVCVCVNVVRLGPVSLCTSDELCRWWPVEKQLQSGSCLWTQHFGRCESHRVATVGVKELEP